MKIETELNVGDKVWILKDYQIIEAEVDTISIWIRPNSNDCKRELQYGLFTGNCVVCSVYEGTEGKYYFRTKQALIDHITRQ